MELPPLEHPVWLEIICGQRTYPFESLALKILLRTLTRSATADPSPRNLLHCTKMLRDLFARNQSSPVIQNDLKKIIVARKLDAV